MPKLTDTQLVILSAAAQRDGGTVLPLPESLKINKAADGAGLAWPAAETAAPRR